MAITFAHLASDADTRLVDAVCLADGRLLAWLRRDGRPTLLCSADGGAAPAPMGPRGVVIVMELGHQSALPAASAGARPSVAKAKAGAATTRSASATRKVRRRRVTGAKRPGKGTLS